MDKICIGKNVETDDKVCIDLEYLIDQKLQILGNSRSGKSRLARVIAESGNGKVHQIIISPKKEYVTLREKFNYIHVGKSSELSNPDIELNTKYAEQLALDIMKVGMDVIIEFSEAPKERIKFVKNFVEGLMMVPQKYWHPTVVFVDEIDIWAPEKGHGEAESLGAMVDLAARGADKGYSLVAITQKLAKFNKDVASELNIKLVGNVSLDTDQNRACEELGIERKNKKILATLGKPNYHFFAYGPGLSDEVIKIKSYNPITSHIPGWKLNKNTKPIPTPDKVKKLLKEFSNLEVEAEKEIKTKKEMKDKINELQAKLKQAERTQAKQDPKQLEHTFQKGHKEGFDEATKQFYQTRKELERMIKNFEDYTTTLENIIKKTVDNLTTITNLKRPELSVPKPTAIQQPKVKSVFSSPKGYVAKEPITIGEPVKQENIEPGPKKILDSIAIFHPEGAFEPQVGIISGYKSSGGTFGEYTRRLKRQDLITKQGKFFKLTDLGESVADNIGEYPTSTSDQVKFWYDKLGSGPGKMLEVIIEQHEITLEDLAEQTNYASSGGTFNEYLRRLKRLHLVEVENKTAKPNNMYFPMVVV